MLLGRQRVRDCSSYCQVVIAEKQARHRLALRELLLSGKELFGFH